MKNILKCLVVMLSVIGGAQGCIFEDEGNPENKIRPGDRLPRFSVTMNDGTLVDAASLTGKVSCIVLFNTSCPDCRQVMPIIQRLYDEFAGQGNCTSDAGTVRFVLISREENAASISRHWEEEGFTMPYSAQEDRAVYNLFASSGVPRIYLSDKDGTVRFVHDDNPVPDYETLRPEIMLLL